MADDGLTSLAKPLNTALEPLNRFVQGQIERLPTYDGYSRAYEILSRLQASGGPGGPLGDLPLDVKRLQSAPEEARVTVDEADRAREHSASASASSGARYGEAVRRAADLTDGWLRIATRIARHVLEFGRGTPYVVSDTTSGSPARLYGVALRNAKAMLPVLSDELRFQLKWSLAPAFLERRRARRLVDNSLRESERRLRDAEQRYEAGIARAIAQVEADRKDLDTLKSAEIAMQEREVAQAQADLDRAKAEYERVQADATLTAAEKQSRSIYLRGEVEFQEELLAMESDSLRRMKDIFGA
jgi:hypothetical protein